jgi:hypothetical protein
MAAVRSTPQVIESCVVWLTVTLYAAACCLPATTIGDYSGGALSDVPVNPLPGLGWHHLVCGWLSGLQGLPAWSSNFVLWAGIVCLLERRLRKAAVLGVAAALLGLTTLTSFKHDHRYIGYYLWQSSELVFAAGSILLCLRARDGESATLPGATPDTQTAP